MKYLKFIWNHLGTRIWLLVSSITLVVLLVVSLVVTQVGFLRGTLNIVFTGDRPIISGTTGRFETEEGLDSKSDVLAAANAFNVSVAEEGITLLKNNNSLPLKKDARVSVFGKNSVNLVYGGSGSSKMSSASLGTLYNSLTDAGITFNPTLKSFYDSSASGSGRAKEPEMGSIIAGFATGETSVSSYTDSVKASFGDYDDAALVVFSRIGGEGFDLPRTMKTSYAANAGAVEGARSGDDHYLQLDKNETDMLLMACESFDNVIVVINSSETMELGFLDDPTHYAYHENIKGALWIGSPGGTGITALGRVLTGEVTPSGHTVDTYARNFKNDPTWANFGNNNEDGGNAYTVGGAKQNYYFVDYEEGIYVGYRYYETRGFTELQSDPNSTWYKDNVVFPLGYGLSYTTFDWEVLNKTELEAVNLTKEPVTVKVRVTNTGDVKGKDVVQLYVTPPYTPNGIEKSHVVLAGFDKTDMLYPLAESGEGKPNSEVIEIELDPYSIASYDYNGKNSSDFKGYVLEAGDYELKISKNAHDVVDSIVMNAPSDMRYDTADGGTQAAVNRFDDVSSGVTTYMSRTDFEGTFPTRPEAADREVTSEFMSGFAYDKNDEGKPWHTTDMPEQAKSVLSASQLTYEFKDMINVDFDDEKWEVFMNQLTIDQMVNLVGRGAYGTVQLENLGKPLTIEADGPSGFTNFMAMGEPSVYDTCFYASECVLGATYNVDLALRMGEMIGNEAIIGNERGGGMPYSGWYAPAVNIHRSQFGGRNWEYYSEDPLLSGKLAAAVVKGAKSRGVYTFVKHFVANEQETNRDTNGVATWLNEQSLRELYLKPFEYTVKEGGTTAIMSSFNRLGKVWTGGSYPLLTEVLRGEWGFEGMVITDYALNRYLNVEQMIRAGGDLILNQEKLPSGDANASATQVTALRNASKNILYTVVNSVAMNINITGYLLPIWIVALICVDVALLVAAVVWGGLIIYFTNKKEKAQTASE